MTYHKYMHRNHVRVDASALRLLQRRDGSGGGCRLTLKHLSIALISMAFSVALLNAVLNSRLSRSVRHRQSFMMLSADDGVLLGFERAYHKDEAGAGECVGICPPPLKKNATLTGFIWTLIEKRIVASPALRDWPALLSRATTPAAHVTAAPMSGMDRSDLYAQLSTWNSPQRLIPTQVDDKLVDVLAVLRTTSLTALHSNLSVSLDDSLSGVLQPLNKPTLRPANLTLLSFHLARILSLQRHALVVGIVFDVKKTLRPVARDPTLFLNRDHRLCLLAKRECLSSLARRRCGTNQQYVCAQDDDQLPTTVTLLSQSARLYTLPHPWSSGDAIDSRHYCSSHVLKDAFFSQSTVLLDLIEMAIFDYLLGSTALRVNVTIHVTSRGENDPPSVLLHRLPQEQTRFTPTRLAALAPLFQCCRVRHSFYNSLQFHAAERDLGSSLDESLARFEPELYGRLFETQRMKDYLNSINERLTHVLALIELCMDQRGRDVVLKLDE